MGNLRKMTQNYQNRTTKWNKDGKVPSGWGHVEEPNLLEKVAHFAYQKLQFWNSPKPKESTHGNKLEHKMDWKKENGKLKV